MSLSFSSSDRVRSFGLCGVVVSKYFFKLILQMWSSSLVDLRGLEEGSWQKQIKLPTPGMCIHNKWLEPLKKIGIHEK